MTKEEILARIKSERSKLEETISSVSSKDKCIPDVVGEWSVKDIMMHLVWWEQHFLEMYQDKDEVSYSGHLASEKLNVKETNDEIYSKYKDVSLKRARSEFDSSYKEVIKAIKEFPEAMLQEEVPFPFSSATWEKHIAWDTYSHYKWARTHIRKWLKGKES